MVSNLFWRRAIVHDQFFVHDLAQSCEEALATLLGALDYLHCVNVSDCLVLLHSAGHDVVQLVPSAPSE
eukprot:2537462-Pyramimonas_sp.AAC.1